MFSQSWLEEVQAEGDLPRTCRVQCPIQLAISYLLYTFKSKHKWRQEGIFFFLRGDILMWWDLWPVTWRGCLSFPLWAAVSPEHFLRRDSTPTQSFSTSTAEREWLDSFSPPMGSNWACGVSQFPSSRKWFHTSLFVFWSRPRRISCMFLT